MRRMFLPATTAISPSVTDWLSAIGTDVGAIGTVGALIFLGIQARRLGHQTGELRRQNEAEANARRRDAELQRAGFRSDHTPFLSIEARGTRPGTESLGDGTVGSFLAVTIAVYADGAGVAHNLIVNFSQIADPPPHQPIATAVIPLLRAPGGRTITLKCPPSLSNDTAHSFRLEVRFLNMFNETVALTHSARFRNHELEITDAPDYEGPWRFQ